MKRYAYKFCEMEEDENGPYVMYVDAMSAINKLLDHPAFEKESNSFSINSEQVIAGILILEKSSFHAEYDQLVTWLRAQYKLTRLGASESIEKAITKGDIRSMIVSDGVLVKVVD